MQKDGGDTQKQLGVRTRDWPCGQLAIAAGKRLCSNGAMTERAKPAIDEKQAALLRQVPSVDELLLRPRVAALAGRMDRGYLVEIVREVLANLRGALASGDPSRRGSWELSGLEPKLEDYVEEVLESSLQPVINASGVILHTNLGRAPLSELVIEEFRRTAIHYNNLEYDLSEGARGKRDGHTARLIQRLTGAEAAIVVNNCAAGLLVTLAALARGGEVIISRGELIEIGDGFRIPEIMEQSGAILREVGTTNRTRIVDYENAINEKTRILLRVNPSNFQVTGFTEKPEVSQLVRLGLHSGLPVMEDLGSGCMVDLSRFGITEPTARESVGAGIPLVLFSGDKLLGGPQAGIIAGKKELVAKVRRHPLFRALRVDKLTIAALEVTLRAYLQASWDEIPVQQMIRASADEIGKRAADFVHGVQTAIPAGGVKIDILDGASLVGGGSTPSQSLPTKIIRIASSRYSANELEQQLRSGCTGSTGIPVIARIEDDCLRIDLRTVFPEQQAALAQSVIAALS
jgi:L-seryl-tRNA(Ser) seleniumtransferase